MTDRAKGCWIAFEHDIRTDDVEPLVAAIKQLRGVAAVELSIASPDDWMCRVRAGREIRKQIMGLLYPDITE